VQPVPWRPCLQWLFLIEGVPSVVLGVAIAVWLPSSPLSAAMLTADERVLLHEKVNQSKLAATHLCMQLLYVNIISKQWL
jgi:ACS family tartrate transporter-like MFS transporter